MLTLTDISFKHLSRLQTWHLIQKSHFYRLGISFENHSLPDLASHSKVSHFFRIGISFKPLSHFSRIGLSFKNLSFLQNWHLFQKSLTFTELASHSNVSHSSTPVFKLTDISFKHLQVDWRLIQTSSSWLTSHSKVCHPSILSSLAARLRTRRTACSIRL